MGHAQQNGDVLRAGFLSSHHILQCHCTIGVCGARDAKTVQVKVFESSRPVTQPQQFNASRGQLVLLQGKDLKREKKSQRPTICKHFNFPFLSRLSFSLLFPPYLERRMFFVPGVCHSCQHAPALRGICHCIHLRHTTVSKLFSLTKAAEEKERKKKISRLFVWLARICLRLHKLYKLGDFALRHSENAAVLAIRHVNIAGLLQNFAEKKHRKEENKNKLLNTCRNEKTRARNSTNNAKNKRKKYALLSAML